MKGKLSNNFIDVAHKCIPGENDHALLLQHSTERQLCVMLAAEGPQRLRMKALLRI